jgi:hypothetical protein
VRSSGGTPRRRDTACASPAPIVATVTPTVWANQKSVFGPVTHSNERRCISGQTPVPT